MKTDKPNLLGRKEQEQIRAAFRAGKKQITLDGITFTIRKRTKDGHWEAGPTNAKEPRQQKEHWLVVTPIGQLTPTANIELVAGGNLRSRS